MEQRGSMKARARKVLKKHYWMCVALCLVSAAIGSEFSASLAVIRRIYPPDSPIQMGAMNRQTACPVFFWSLLRILNAGKEKERQKKRRRGM